VPYVYGPLDGQTAVLDVPAWAEQPPGVSGTVDDRYVLVQRAGVWQLRYEPNLHTEEVPANLAEVAALLAGAEERREEPCGCRKPHPSWSRLFDQPALEWSIPAD
jgi:hypothetical protein